MLENIKFVINLLPLLVQLIKSVEQAIPTSGKGSDKLAMVRGILESIDAGLLASWPMIEKIITVIVKTFNNTGTFKEAA